MADGTTDATGAFLVNDIPGNAEFGITISKTGYATISQEAEKIVSAVGDEPLKDGANYYDITMYSLATNFRLMLVGESTIHPAPATDKVIVQACFALPIIPGNLDSAVQYCMPGEYTLQSDTTKGLVAFTAAPDFDELIAWAGITSATIKIEDTTGVYFPQSVPQSLTSLGRTLADSSPAVVIELVRVSAVP